MHLKIYRLRNGGHFVQREMSWHNAQNNKIYQSFTLSELWCFRWSVPEQTAQQTIEAPVIWDAIAPIMTSLQLVMMGGVNKQSFIKIAKGRGMEEMHIC